MMRPIARFWIAPLVVLVILAAVVGVYLLVNRPKAAPPSSPSLVPVTVDQIQSLTFQQSGKSLTLYQEPSQNGGTQWTIGSPQGVAADQQLTSGFAASLVTLTPTRTLTASPTAAQLQEYGLQPPQASVTVKASGRGKPVVLDVGNASPTGSYYAQIQGQSQVYLLNGLLPSEIRADPTAWLPQPTSSTSSSGTSATSASSTSGSSG